jgi:hypothetical protein
MIGDAVISPDGLYRYQLRRMWQDRSAPVVFVMLNPSTADAHRDDATIRKCVGFARRWGRTSLTVVNLFAYRTTVPARLTAVLDPVGPDNDAAICRAVAEPPPGASLVVVAWGRGGGFLGRGKAVTRLLYDAGAQPLCLGVTATGHPRHPLYLPFTTTLSEYPPAD